MISGASSTLAHHANGHAPGLGRRQDIAILNTWSDINPCHVHFKSRVADVKRGVLQAGGFPVELPALSLSESFVKPTTMLYRNLLAMDVEELIRSHPIDGVVLMGGCDKTTPALLWGDQRRMPAIYLPAKTCWRMEGQILGSVRCVKIGTSAAPGRSPMKLGLHRRRASPQLRHLHDQARRTMTAFARRSA